jgi:hypothetical protein
MPPVVPSRYSPQLDSRHHEYPPFLLPTTATDCAARTCAGLLKSYYTLKTCTSQSQHRDPRRERRLPIHQRPLALERSCTPRGETQTVQHRGTQKSSRRGHWCAIMLTNDQAHRRRFQQSIQTFHGQQFRGNCQESRIPNPNMRRVDRVIASEVATVEFVRAHELRLM